MSGGAGNDTFLFAIAPSTQAGTIWVGSINDQGDQPVFINRDGGTFDHTILVHVDPGVSLQASYQRPEFVTDFDAGRASRPAPRSGVGSPPKANTIGHSF